MRIRLNRLCVPITEKYAECIGIYKEKVFINTVHLPFVTNVIKINNEELHIMLDIIASDVSNNIIQPNNWMPTEIIENSVLYAYLESSNILMRIPSSEIE